MFRRKYTITPPHVPTGQPVNPEPALSSTHEGASNSAQTTVNAPIPTVGVPVVSIVVLPALLVSSDPSQSAPVSRIVLAPAPPLFQYNVGPPMLGFAGLPTDMIPLPDEDEASEVEEVLGTIPLSGSKKGSKKETKKPPKKEKVNRSVKKKDALGNTQISFRNDQSVRGVDDHFDVLYKLLKLDHRNDTDDGDDDLSEHSPVAANLFFSAEAKEVLAPTAFSFNLFPEETPPSPLPRFLPGEDKPVTDCDDPVNFHDDDDDDDEMRACKRVSDTCLPPAQRVRLDNFSVATFSSPDEVGDASVDEEEAVDINAIIESFTEEQLLELRFWGDRDGKLINLVHNPASIKFLMEMGYKDAEAIVHYLTEDGGGSVCADADAQGKFTNLNNNDGTGGWSSSNRNR